MDPKPDGGPSAWRHAFGIAVAILLVIFGIYMSRTPRRAWGTRIKDRGTPKDHVAYLVYGSSTLDSMRIGLTKHRIVYVAVPPDGSADTGWPRRTGRTRPSKIDVEEELELVPP